MSFLIVAIGLDVSELRGPSQVTESGVYTVSKSLVLVYDESRIIHFIDRKWQTPGRVWYFKLRNLIN